MAATATLLTRDIQGESLNAATDRLVNSILFNEGVVDVAGNSFQVLQNLGTDMNVKIGSGTAFDRAVIEGDLAGQGKYVTEHQNATQILAVAASDPTNDRIDNVILRIFDDTFDSSTFDYADIEVTTGTPSGSPVPPTIPGGSFVLAEILVQDGVTQIVNGDITDKRIEYTMQKQTFVGWQLHKNANQTFDTGAQGVLTDVIWQVEDIDSDGFHSGSDAIVTVPAGAGGYYAVEFQGIVASNVADDDVVLFYLDHDGTPVVYVTLLPNQAAPGIIYSVPIGFTKLINLAVGDVLKIINYRGGSPMDIDLSWQSLAQGGPLTYFSGHRIAS